MLRANIYIFLLPGKYEGTFVPCYFILSSTLVLAVKSKQPGLYSYEFIMNVYCPNIAHILPQIDLARLYRWKTDGRMRAREGKCNLGNVLLCFGRRKMAKT